METTTMIYAQFRRLILGPDGKERSWMQAMGYVAFVPQIGTAILVKGKRVKVARVLCTVDSGSISIVLVPDFRPALTWDMQDVGMLSEEAMGSYEGIVGEALPTFEKAKQEHLDCGWQEVASEQRGFDPQEVTDRVRG